VTLGDTEAPTTLPELELDPLELAEQAANVRELAGIQGGLGISFGYTPGSTPETRPWTGDLIPPGASVTYMEAEILNGEYLAPPNTYPGKTKKARFRRPREDVREGISRLVLEVGEDHPRGPNRLLKCGTCGSKERQR
jgi:hypothetical protein